MKLPMVSTMGPIIGPSLPHTHLHPFPLLCDEGEVEDSGIRGSCLLQTLLDITRQLSASGTSGPTSGGWRVCWREGGER